MKKEITFASKIDNIAQVEALLEEIALKYSIGDEIYGNILVAILEAVNNAILHGNMFDPSKSVTLEFDIKDQHFYFKITDQGEGFDYNTIPDPTMAENIENPHGRGVFLMRHLADSVTYSNNGSSVELLFNI